MYLQEDILEQSVIDQKIINKGIEQGIERGIERGEKSEATVFDP